MARNKTYKETKLPKRLDKSIAGVMWQAPDVLVGALRNRYQLDICLQCGFYHMPVTNIDPAKVRYVAIYQSLNLFGKWSGIRWFGKVKKYEKVKRREIYEIPKDSDEWYYRFEIKKWRAMSKSVTAGGVAFVHMMTNHFLLRNCRTVTELLACSEHEFRWIQGLKKAMARAKRFPKRGGGFWFDRVLTVVNGNTIVCTKDGKTIGRMEEVTSLAGSYEEIYNLYGQIFPEYAYLERTISYAE